MAYKRQCEFCGKDIYVLPCQIKNGDGKYCSRKCYGDSKKGKIMTWINNCGRVAWNRGMKFPELSGVNSPVWKGGNTKETIKRTTTSEWKILRREIYTRDGWKCKKCGKHCRKDIQCHHIIPYRFCNNDENKILFWNVTINSTGNLTTLCKPCHSKIEREFQKLEKEGRYGFTAIYHLVA